MEDLDGQLRAHAERQAERLQEALARYFDPESGQLGERLRQLTGDGGTLARTSSTATSVLRTASTVQTLVKHVGERSPLFEQLSPTDSEGLSPRS